MRLGAPWYFSHPTTAVTSQEPSSLSMAASHKCKHIERKQRCCPVRTGGNYDNDRVRCRVIRFNERKENMTIRRVEIERLSVTSSKPFEVVVAALKAAVGQPDMVEFVKETRGPRT